MTDAAIPTPIVELIAGMMAPRAINPLHLNPANVPSALRDFIPEAALLGIGDDGYRVEVARELPLEYVNDLRERLHAHGELAAWLSQGTPAGEPIPLEYVALSCLVMLVDRAMQFWHEWQRIMLEEPGPALSEEALARFEGRLGVK